MTPTYERIAEEAYKAYGDSAGWKNYAGGPMPVWGALPVAIRKHWAAAVVRMDEFLNEAALEELAKGPRP
jgi:hypothetical protein